MSTSRAVRNLISSRSIRGTFTESQGFNRIFPASTAAAMILRRICSALTAVLAAIGLIFRFGCSAVFHQGRGPVPVSFATQACTESPWVTWRLHGEDLLRADDDVPNDESINEQTEEAAEFGMTERAAD